VPERPTDVLTCYRARRRLGAYLDGALEGADAGRTERHLTGCTSCQREVGELRRVKALVAGAAAAIPDPDWTGFFPGIVRGIEAERHRTVTVPAPSRRWALWPRWAMGGAAVAVAALALVLWQGGGSRVPAEAGVLVDDANTENPGATVMVYTSPDRQVAVVWLFEAD
jgi:anti-sigma factor RsiW